MNAERDPIILTYHSISAGRPPLAISPAVFAEQMAWLNHNCHVVPLGTVVESLKNGKLLTQKTIVLTFDDGYQDFYTDAAPILYRFGFPATVFVPTGYCGGTNSWPGQPSWVEQKPLLSWPQIKELAKQRIEFCPHSVTHADLTALPDAECEREMLESKRMLDEHSGGTSHFFCYPYGRWNSSVREIASRHFESACSTAAGPIQQNSDPFVLPRVDAVYVRNLALFRSLFTRRFAAYLAARRTIRRLRGQPEGHYSKR
jgi:peptidoglycan/xylan/chitin deacetylase (PgdA/CDA1 family)